MAQLYKRTRTLGDLLQGEGGTTVGQNREVVSVTATAGTKLIIGRILQKDETTGAVTVPADSADVTNPVIYIGDDPISNPDGTDGIHDYDPNTTEFKAGALTQNVVILYRGYDGVAIGMAALIYPEDAEAAEKAAINKLLDAKGFKLVRQVAFPEGV